MFDLSNEREAVLFAKKSWLQFEQNSSVDIRVGLAGSFTLDALLPLLGAHLLDKGFISPKIMVAPYNQIYQTCLNHDTTFGESHVDAIIIIWRIEDLLLAHFNSFLQGNIIALETALQEVDSLAAGISHLRSVFAGTIIVSSPPFPVNIEISIRDLTNSKQGGFFHRCILDRWMGCFDNQARIHFIDLDGLQRYYGIAHVYDDRKWYLYKQPFKEGFLFLLAEELGRLLAIGRGNGKKCIVLDCDNTLWGGIVGEDGLVGIEIGDEFPGSAFCDFQRQLLRLQRKGIYLALASKNNESDVWEVFEHHDAMILKREHIAISQIHWHSKTDSLIEIARVLNIGLDSFVFIDDSRFEIEQVQQSLPQVTCLQVPTESAYLPGMLRDCHLFDQLETTIEDRERTSMVLQEKQRQVFQKSLSNDEFIASLHLEIDVFKACPVHIARITQLINKTNQFNLSTRRRSFEEVVALTKADDYDIFALRVKDRFGEYGLVGVAIVQAKNQVWVLDTFLLSCRVLGRQVETAFLAFIVEAAKLKNITTMRGIYVPTPKNMPIADFLPQQGFKEISSGEWEVSLVDIKA